MLTRSNEPQDTNPEKSLYEIGDTVQIRGGDWSNDFSDVFEIEYKYFEGCWHYADKERQNWGKFVCSCHIRPYETVITDPALIGETGKNVYGIPIDILKALKEDNADKDDLEFLLSVLLPEEKTRDYDVMSYYWYCPHGDISRFNNESHLYPTELLGYELEMWEDCYWIASFSYRIWRDCQILINAPDSAWYDHLKHHLVYLSEDALHIYKEAINYEAFAKRVQKQIRKKKASFVFDVKKINTAKYNRETTIH